MPATGPGARYRQGIIGAALGSDGTLTNESVGGQSRQSAQYGKKSFLDPHLSVLELLDRACELPSAGEEGSFSRNIGPPQSVNMEKSTNSISESWQAIQRGDNYISVVPERCPSQSTAAGILSSSDTSEEEMEAAISPSIEEVQQSHQQQQQLRSLSEFGSIPLNVPLFMPEAELAYARQDDRDDETITKSLTSSSNSFVMPKLSLSQKSQKFRILILGRPGLKFYQGIPKRYQGLFEVSRFQNTSDFKQFTGVLVVFQELKEMISLLSRICHSSPVRPIIPICQTGQRQQVKNVLNSMSKSKLISLLYPPVVASNHSDLNKMYKFLHDLSKSLSDNSENEYDESDIQEQEAKKSFSRKRKKLSSTGKHNKDGKDIGKGEKMNRWVVWGISLTVGVGIGYFMSYFVSSAWISVTTKSLSHMEHCVDGKNFVVFEDASLELSDHHSDTDYSFSHVLGIFKETVKQWNGAFKQFLNKQISIVEELTHFNRDDWNEENANRVLALGYILL